MSQPVHGFYHRVEFQNLFVCLFVSNQKVGFVFYVGVTNVDHSGYGMYKRTVSNDDRLQGNHESMIQLVNAINRGNINEV